VATSKAKGGELARRVSRGDASGELDPSEIARLENEERILDLLGELGGSSFADEQIKHEGDQLIIPEGMAYMQAARAIVDAVERMEEQTQFSKTFPYRPMDGAWCTWRALKEAFGAVGHDSRTVQTFFGPMKVKPEVRTIAVGPKKEEQVPWGNFTVPFLPGVELSLGEARDPKYGIVFAVTASGPRKYQHQMQGIFKMIAEKLATESIYRGKAIDGGATPGYIDLSGVDPARVIYHQDIWRQLDANLFSPLRFAEEHRDLRLPLKRATLLAGDYGTGKTLAAYLTGQVATNHGWTFIMARPGEDDLVQVMQTARLYQPCVVFYEDMDTVASADQTADATTRMLEIFDGIPSKGTEIMVVLTTNHVDRIHKGMLRAGRLDSVIPFGKLDATGIEDLVKSLIQAEMLDEDIDYAVVFEAMKDFHPAFAKEAIDRTVRYALPRVDGDADAITLTTDDFVSAAHGLDYQLKLMNDALETRQPDTLGMVIDRHVVEAVRGNIREDLLNHPEEDGEE
jgi:transitional endoplasmic reticulum ATPase